MSENGNRSTNEPGERKLPRQLQTVGVLLFAVVLVILNSLSFVSDYPFAKLIALLTAFGACVGAIIGFVFSLRFASPPWEFIRPRLLVTIKATWIDGVLHSTVGPLEPFELNVQIAPDVVLHPRPIGQQTQRNTNEILRIHKDMQRKLLILGDEGSGKTTLMLQLAAKLIEEAEQEKNTPIPVILNLSTWTTEYQSLESWIVSRLRREYKLSDAKKLVHMDKFILLLDGLDELDARQVGNCIEAINTFLANHRVEMVVCCQGDVYKQQQVKLDFGGAIVLCPLVQEQIDLYLNSRNLAGLRHLLQEEKTLTDLTAKPLLLNLMAQAYYGKSAEELRLRADADHRIQIYDDYINKQYDKSAAPVEWRPLNRYLAWLASQMNEFGLSIFQLESLQPIWLRPKTQTRLYLWGNLLVGFIGTAAIWPLAGLGGTLIFLIVWLAVDLGSKAQIRPVERWWVWPERGLWLGVTAGVGVALLATVAAGGNWVLGIASGCTFIIGFLLMLALTDTAFRTGETLNRSVRPNQGIWQSARAATLVGLAFIFCLLLAVGFLARDLAVRDIGLAILAAVGVFAVGFLLSPGGVAFRRHFILRAVLWRYGYTPIPSRYVKFLDFAAELQILHKVGGGYQFHHRELQNYFAALHDKT